MRQMLQERHVLVIVGPPFVGKSWAAQHLARELCETPGGAYEYVLCSSRDPQDLLGRLGQPGNMVLFVDDVFGATQCEPELISAWEGGLPCLADAVREEKKVIITSRTPVLVDALPHLEKHRIRALARAAVTLGDDCWPSASLRCVLRNHVDAKGLGPRSRDLIASNEQAIVQALKYPLELKQFVDAAAESADLGRDLGRIIEHSQHVEDSFYQYVVHALGPASQALLLAVGLLDQAAPVQTARDLFEEVCPLFEVRLPEASFDGVLARERDSGRLVLDAGQVRFRHPVYRAAVGRAARDWEAVCRRLVGTLVERAATRGDGDAAASAVEIAVSMELWSEGNPDAVLAAGVLSNALDGGDEAVLTQWVALGTLCADRPDDRSCRLWEAEEPRPPLVEARSGAQLAAAAAWEVCRSSDLVRSARRWTNDERELVRSSRGADRVLGSALVAYCRHRDAVEDLGSLVVQVGAPQSIATLYELLSTEPSAVRLQAVRVLAQVVPPADFERLAAVADDECRERSEWWAKRDAVRDPDRDDELPEHEIEHLAEMDHWWGLEGGYAAVCQMVDSPEHCWMALKCLRAASGDERAFWLTAVGKMDHGDALGLLRAAALDCDDPWTSSRAVRSIRRRYPDELAGVLAELLVHGGAAGLESAVHALYDNDELPTGLAQDLPADIRYALELGLRAYGRDSGSLDRALAASGDPIRDALIHDVTDGLGEAEVAQLRVLAGSEYSCLRARTVAVLAAVEASASSDVVGNAVSDGSWEVQLQAIKALRQVGLLHRRDLLVQGYDAARAAVRRAVVESLAGVEDYWAHEILVRAIDDRVWRIRKAAVEALAARREQASIPAIAGKLRDGDGDDDRYGFGPYYECPVSRAAVRGLRVIGGEDAGAHLDEFVSYGRGRSWGPDIIAYSLAIDALGSMGYASAASLLIGLLSDTARDEPVGSAGPHHYPIREAAAGALGALGVGDAADELVAVVAGACTWSARAAIASLSELARFDLISELARNAELSDSARAGALLHLAANGPAELLEPFLRVALDGSSEKLALLALAAGCAERATEGHEDCGTEWFASFVAGHDDEPWQALEARELTCGWPKLYSSADGLTRLVVVEALSELGGEPQITELERIMQVEVPRQRECTRRLIEHIRERLAASQM